MTFPVSSRWLPALQSSHNIAVRFEVLNSTLATVLYASPIFVTPSNELAPSQAPTAAIQPEIYIQSGKVSMDKQTTQRSRLDMVIVDSTGLLVPKHATDPLTTWGNIIRVWRGIKYPDGTVEMPLLGTFRMTDVVVAENNGVFTIAITGQDLSYVVARNKVVNFYQSATNTAYTDVIRSMVQFAYPGVQFSGDSVSWQNQPAHGPATGTYSNVILQRGPSGYWKCDDAVGSTTLVDSSGGGITATRAGGTASLFGTPGAIRTNPAGTAVQFNDNLTEFGAFTPIAGATAYSLEIWVKASLPDLGQAFIFNSNPFGIGIHANAPGTPGGFFSVSTQGGARATATGTAVQTINDGTWHRIVATQAGVTTGPLLVYYDNNLILTDTSSHAATAVPGSDPMKIGAGFGGSNGSGHYLDEVSIYPRVLSAAEINQSWLAAQYGFLFTSNVFTDSLVPLIWQEGTDLWSEAKKMANAISCDLFFDRYGVCTLVTDPNLSYMNASIPLPPVPIRTFTEGTTATFSQVQRALSDSKVMNSWIVTGEGAVVGRGPLRSAPAIDNDPNSATYIYGGYGVVTGFETNTYMVTQGQLDSYAQWRLKTSIGSQESVQIQGFVDTSIDVDDPISVKRQRVGINNVLYIADAPSFPLAAKDVMTIRMRERRSIS